MYTAKVDSGTPRVVIALSIAAEVQALRHLMSTVLTDQESEFTKVFRRLQLKSIVHR